MSHFTPTSASWINQVERFFALLTDRAIRRGVFRSVADLETAITAYIEATNADPKPFRWTKSADDILATSNASAFVQSVQTHRMEGTLEWDTIAFCIPRRRATAIPHALR